MSSKRKWKVALVAGCVAVALGAGVSVAHSADHEKTPRVQVMWMIAKNMKALGAFAKGEARPSADLADKARQIATLSHTVVAMFPKGSEGGRAKAEIWSDWAGFVKAADDFKAAAPKLVAAADSMNAGQVGAALGAVGKTCGGCHKPFRTPKK